MAKTYFILVIILLLILFSRSGSLKNVNVKYYDFVASPYTLPCVKVCFIAGVHGNEPAGAVTLIEMIKIGYFNDFIRKNPSVMIRVIPCVNMWGLRRNSRYQPNVLYPDINRNFTDEGLDQTSKSVIKLVHGFDIVIDFHEGYSFHLINDKSMGSTVSPTNTRLATDLAMLITEKLNQYIQNPLKKFIVLEGGSCEIPKTLSCFQEKRHRHYILIETSGQNDIQPLKIRGQQIYIVVNEVLNFIIQK